MPPCWGVLPHLTKYAALFKPPWNIRDTVITDIKVTESRKHGVIEQLFTRGSTSITRVSKTGFRGSKFMRTTLKCDILESAGLERRATTTQWLDFTIPLKVKTHVEFMVSDSRGQSPRSRVMHLIQHTHTWRRNESWRITVLSLLVLLKKQKQGWPEDPPKPLSLLLTHTQTCTIRCKHKCNCSFPLIT